MELRLNKSVLRKHQSEKETTKHFNILLVDDEKENLDSLSLVLDKEYNLTFANDGQEALDMLRSGAVPDDLHMIISDQRMPRMTGVELFQEARELKPDAVRIILTGFTDADAIISSINEGQIYKFLTKPIDPVDLRVTVRRSLEYHVLEQENVKLVVDLKKRVKEVENLVKAFEQFVPRQFTQRIASEGVQNIENMDLGKAHADTVSILFADIRNFTSLSETLPPQDVLDFLNECFACMGESVHSNNGFVDKYIGDAIMALFDSSDASDESQVFNAVQSAIQMQRAIAKLNDSRGGQGFPALEVGIGVHTGPVIIGTVGVQSRMDLTVLGDAVNVAARLEQLTKVYGTPIIVSASSHALVAEQEAFHWREIDCLRVKGRAEPLLIYEVFSGESAAQREEEKRFLALYARALAHYYAGDLSAASDIFRECLDSRPNDQVSAIYLQRCSDDNPDSELQELRKLHPAGRRLSSGVQ